MVDTPDTVFLLVDRTREVASLAALFLRHGRKRKLSVDDMNRALKWSDVGQVSDNS